MTSKNCNLLLSNKAEKLFNVPKVLYDNRYCNQDDFSILVYGRKVESKRSVSKINEFYQLIGPKLECTKFRSMLEGRCNCNTAIIGSDIIVVGGYNYAHKTLYSVEVFKGSKKSWFYKIESTSIRKIHY